MGRGTVRVDSNKLDIRSGHPVQLARDELLPEWGYKQYMPKLNEVLQNLPKGTLKQQSVALLNAAEAARDVDPEAYYANRMALTIVRRAEYIEQQQENGEKTITKVVGKQGLDNQIAQAIELSSRKEVSALDARNGVPSTVVRAPHKRNTDLMWAQALGVSAQAAEIKPDAAKPFKASLGIAGQDPLELAVKEISAAYNTDLSSLNNVLANYKPEIVGKTSIFLNGFKAIDDAAKAADPKQGAEAQQSRAQYELARNVLVRAHDIAMQQQGNGPKVIARLDTPQAYDAYTKRSVTRWREYLASGGAVASDAEVAAAGTAVAPDTSAPAPAGAQALTPAQKKSIQFDMEALGYATGQSGGFDAAKGVDGMDGEFGKVTRPNLNKFLADNSLTELNAEAIEKLHTLAEAKRAQLAQAQPAPAQPAATPTAEQPAANEAVIAALKATAGKDQNDNDYTGYTTVDNIPTMFKELLGIDMAEAQKSRITMVDGRISSEDILKLEKALNAVRGDAPAMQEDGKWDARLTALAQQEGIKTFIGAVFNPTTVADSSAPANTPGQTSSQTRSQS